MGSTRYRRARLAVAVGHGRVLSSAQLGVDDHPDGGPWPVVDPEGRLLAVYVGHRAGTAKPGVVLA
jgi:hypothetical protein